MDKQTLRFIIGAIVIFTFGLAAGALIFKRPNKEPVCLPAVEQPQPVVKQTLSTPGVGAEKFSTQLQFQKGIAYVAWTKDGYSNQGSVESMERLAQLGVKWVSLVPIWFQERTDSTQIYPVREKTVSDESLLFAIRKLHDLNIQVMLKPHLDLIDSEGRWRGDIGVETQDQWQEWFASYTDFILRYARLAQQEGVQILCIGTELSKTTVSQPELWQELIAKVRAVYQGQLTYAANWYEEFDYITFWDKLDYAGVDPYFPMVDFPQPTREQLTEVWEDWLQMISGWQARINKPVIFTEIGYKSSEDSAAQPWVHTAEGDVDLQLQADCYQTLLEAFYDQPWFYGVYWWYWGVNTKMGGEHHRGFTPQNKTAEQIISDWYQRPVNK